MVVGGICDGWCEPDDASYEDDLSGECPAVGEQVLSRACGIVINAEQYGDEALRRFGDGEGVLDEFPCPSEGWIFDDCVAVVGLASQEVLVDVRGVEVIAATAQDGARCPTSCSGLPDRQLRRQVRQQHF